MIIIGCDFHTRFQQVAMLDPTTGEVSERRLEHETGEAATAVSRKEGQHLPERRLRERPGFSHSILCYGLLELGQRHRLAVDRRDRSYVQLQTLDAPVQVNVVRVVARSCPASCRPREIVCLH
jgi:hypothetical protein